jgi:SAM-dependent methyltransferase
MPTIDAERLARERAVMPATTRAILDSRSLQTGHRRLSELLARGMRVLDVGCGTGAITRGIADAVGPEGQVIGVDTNAGFVEEARRAHGAVANLSFEVHDAYRLPFRETFDLVSASRVLQWLADPLGALRGMAAAARPGARVIVLDYHHAKIAWVPDPPASMRRFYAAFLAWRAETGMDNAIADRLVGLFAAVGLEEIVVSPQHEPTVRGQSDFTTRAAIWADVAASRGYQMVRDGAVTEAERAAAEVDYREWVRDRATSQTLYLLAVEGRRPAERGDAGVRGHMLEVVTMKEIDAIFAVTDSLGIHREHLVIPLGPTSPGRVRRLPSGKLEIAVDADQPIDDWVKGLPALIAAARGSAG